ncbi:hypothetical protein AVEN_163097-1 [Araneus ventricosus]|uniref:Uncharacterized protein n=1 Tax=Araneus ventricosus TaxID=182803 RepID=A0A4Y2I2Z3_ARAVE|nr:hypothetical protein AVEN_163097-1 [Araneus ventricosus]
MPPERRDGMNESQSSHSSPDDAEAVVGCNDALRERCLLVSSGDGNVSEEKALECETVESSDKNNWKSTRNYKKESRNAAEILQTDSTV